MAKFPYWADNWFATQEIERQFSHLRSQVQKVGSEAAVDLRSVLASIDQCEVDLGRALLKLHALVDVLVDKGLVTADELAAKAQELDELDGESDGILHPTVFRTEEERARTPSPRAFLIALEKRTVSPKAFLAQLERGEQ
jgi:hypothetical protein